MQRQSPYLVADVPGFTPEIGRLVCMLRYARWTTLQTVTDLSVAQLDHLHDEESNSIGALLQHVAAIEIYYQAHTFEGREPNAAELKQWGAALDLGERGRREISGLSLEEHESCLRQVRDKTLQELSRRDDTWLHQESPFAGGLAANNYFKWFHVLEDEINHRGQMRWLRRRLPPGGSWQK